VVNACIFDIVIYSMGSFTIYVINSIKTYKYFNFKGCSWRVDLTITLTTKLAIIVKSSRYDVNPTVIMKSFLRRARLGRSRRCRTFYIKVLNPRRRRRGCCCCYYLLYSRTVLLPQPRRCRKEHC